VVTFAALLRGPVSGRCGRWGPRHGSRATRGSETVEGPHGMTQLDSIWLCSANPMNHQIGHARKIVTSFMSPPSAVYFRSLSFLLCREEHFQGHPSQSWPGPNVAKPIPSSQGKEWHALPWHSLLLHQYD
jgi:hypothetical protein